MAKVLIADGQMLVRVGLGTILRTADADEVVGETGDVEETVATAVKTEPDVVLVDVCLPGGGGAAATRRILECEWECAPRVLILATGALDAYVYAALQAGVSGFVMKNTPPHRLVAAVRTVADGEMYFASEVMRRLIDVYCHAWDERLRAGAGRGRDLARLTARELDVLRMVGTGLTNGEIAARIAVSDGTVKTHLNRAMTKLDLVSRAQAVALAYETGLVVPGRGFDRPGPGPGAVEG